MFAFVFCFSFEDFLLTENRIALRDIEAGEELTGDYAEFSTKHLEMKCNYRIIAVHQLSCTKIDHKKLKGRVLVAVWCVH